MPDEFNPLHHYNRYYKNLQPLLKSKKTQAYFMVVLSLLTISFFGLFAIRPTIKTIAALQRQITDRSYLNTKLEEKINALINAQEEYTRVQSSLPLIYSLLPEKAEFPSLLRRLELLVDEKNATISGIQFDPIILYGDTRPARPLPPTETKSGETATSTIQTSPIFFTLTLSGDYENLVELLDQLTQLERLVTINSVSLTNSQKTGNARLVLGIQSRAYYYPGSR